MAPEANPHLQSVLSPGDKSVLKRLIQLGKEGTVTGHLIFSRARHSQGRQDVRQSDAEVVFLGGLKSREISLMLRCEASHLCRRGTAGHPMPVDRRLRIAGA